jgi:hypothetical protein
MCVLGETVTFISQVSVPFSRQAITHWATTRQSGPPKPCRAIAPRDTSSHLSSQLRLEKGEVIASVQAAAADPMGHHHTDAGHACVTCYSMCYVQRQEDAWQQKHETSDNGANTAAPHALSEQTNRRWHYPPQHSIAISPVCPEEAIFGHRTLTIGRRTVPARPCVNI